MFERSAARLFGLSALCALMILAAAALGQQSGNYADAKKKFDVLTFQKRQELYSGLRPPQGGDDKKFIEAAAEWYVFRVSWQQSSPKDMEKLHDELEKELLNPLLKDRAKNGAVVDLLGKEFVKSFKSVLSKDFAEPDNRAPILNAALMLPPVAKLKQEDFGDFLVALLKDKARHDVVKLYAAKALREFFPASLVSTTAGDDPKDIKFKRGKERVQALADFINRKDTAANQDVIRYMRHEAVVSLAHAGVPAIWANKKSGEIEGPVAYELLRVLVRGKDGFDPPSTLAERVEAALGLCQLKDPQGDTDYDPSVAVYAVGLCFFDYMMEYSKDYANIVGRKKMGAFKTDGPDVKIPTMLWRIQSERFKAAAKELVTNTKGTPAHTNAVSLEKNVSNFAEAIRGYSQVPDMPRIEFRKLVERMEPKTGQLYKLKAPTIDPKSLTGPPVEE